MKHLYLLSILFILAAVLDAEGQSFIVGDDNAVMRSSTEKPSVPRKSSASIS